MEAILQLNLETMVGCSIEQIPSGLVERCERVERLIKQVKPYGSLMSTQVLAVMIASWEGDDFCRRRVLDNLRAKTETEKLE